MSEYLRVEGHQHLVRDTRTNAIVNKNKNAYISYRKTAEAAQRQKDEIIVIANSVAEDFINIFLTFQFQKKRLLSKFKIGFNKRTTMNEHKSIIVKEKTNTKYSITI